MKYIFIYIFLCSACIASASNTEWMILSGYGTSHPGWGDTEEHVETMDLVLRHSRKFKNTGKGWFKGSHNFLIELPIHFVTNPDTSPIYGMNFLSCWKLEHFKKFQPYYFIGGGPIYTEAGIPNMGSKINGNYQTGIGAYFKPTKDRSIAVECRYHHISNASTVEPNMPLNSSKYLIGISIPF